jgi:hypothetical protein
MPDNILEMGLYCIPLDAVELILNGDIGCPSLSAGSKVVFLTPTGGRVCALQWVWTVGSALPGPAALQFSTTWACAMQPLPSLWEINRWNQTVDHAKIYLDDEGDLVLRMDVASKGISAKQVVPIWLAWDGCVESVCERLVSVRMAATKSSFN